VGLDALLASVNDAAKALGLGRTSVYALIKTGQLQKIKVRKRTLITIASIERLIEQGHEMSASGE
jgi:excisionase family DNA binding protein